MVNHQNFLGTVGNVLGHIFVRLMPEYDSADVSIQPERQFIGLGQELQGYSVLEIIAVISKNPNG
jgi:hypothetical protein